MPITEEIRQAAENLGKKLGANPDVLEYINLAKQSREDARVVDLETRLALLNQKLAEREQAGGRLERSVVEEYYELKDLVNEHPLVINRDYRLDVVTALFTQVAQKMTPILGIEYTDFAL